VPKTIGKFQTAQASKYLQQLCKHFAHKVAVEYDQTAGWADLPVGRASLTASDTLLTVEIDLHDLEQKDQGHMIIDSHLEKFAFREDVRTMTWDA